MAGIRKILVFWVCLSFTFFQFPCSAMAEYFAQVKPGPTIKKPEALTSPEEEFPVAEKAGPQEKGGGKWLWALIGVALVGGVAAAMSGGGGGGGSGNGEDTTGTIVISGPAP
jgi:hypothetical protein